MKKIHHKQKSLGVSFTLVIFLFLFFSSGPHAHAIASDYWIEYFDIQTRTYAGGSPETYFWFNILDANDYNFPPMESVVESVTITYPDGSQQSFTPELIPWCHSEWRGSDNNPRNGIIEPDQGEYEKYVNSGIDYEIISPVSPHVPGTYLLEVTCTNGQLLSFNQTVDAGMTAVDLPPVTNVTASFNPGSGLFQVSWDLPETGYPPEAAIQIRVDRFEKDGGKRHARFRVKNLPAGQLIYTFFKWESDLLRLYIPYINVKVRTYMHARASMAQSDVKEYAIDGTDLTPTTITAISEPSILSNDLKTLYVPYLDYKGNLLWMLLHHFGPSPPIAYRIIGIGPVR